MSQIAATERMTRLVAAIPWIVAQNGAPIDEIVERFDYPRELLLDDLQNVVFFVGVPPYTPDTLIEVQIDDGLVWIDYADWFSRPMKLSGGEALALLAAGETVLALDSHGEAGALARGLAKLRLATGTDATALDVELGVAPDEVLRDLRRAIETGVCVDITYYSFGRDERSERRIEPIRLFPEDGRWYVAAYCRVAEADRVFRVDRIAALEVTEEPLTHHATDPDRSVFSIEDQPRAVLRLPADRSHLLDHVAVDRRSVLEDGRVEVELPVSSARWLSRLQLRIGHEVERVDAGDDTELAATVAAVLARYDRPQ
jgi:proteasome accessory factor C